jgi:OmpA-OmpF porin, OOP family
MHHVPSKIIMISTIARTAIIFFSVFSSLATGQILYPTLVESLKDSDKDGVIDIRDLCPNTPRGTAVDNDGCPLIQQEYFRFNFDVQFETGSYRLKNEFHSALNNLALLLQSNPETHLFIEGHTDNIGAEHFNLTLSQKRAQAVANTLTSVFHISPDRINTFGYGQSRPIAPNETETDRLLNRRVSGEIVTPLQNQNKKMDLVIRFKINRYAMADKYRSLLKDLGQKLQEKPDALALIEGYTDNTGNQDHNLVLSAERANKVADILHTEYGIPLERLKTLGHGEANPIASNNTLEGRQQNRRVTIKIVTPFKATTEVLLPKWTIWSVDQMAKENHPR